MYLQYTMDPNVEVRQAAVYGLGVLADQKALGRPITFDEALQQQAAQALIQVIESPGAFEEDNATATDNAVSALGKLCKLSDTIAAAALPRWLKVLPLGADKSEAILVHKHLIEMVGRATHLLGASHERLPDIICVFGQILGTDVSDDDQARRISHLLKQVHAGLPHVLQGLPQHPGFAKLSEQRSALEQAISK